MPIGPAPVIKTSSPSTGKRQRRMHRIAVGVKDRRDFLVDAGLVLPDVGVRQGNQLRERARTVDAHALGVRAQMAAASEAVAAAPADHVALAADDVTRLEVVDIRAHFDNLAHKLVADRHGDRNGGLRPLVPVVDMQVGPANARVAGPDQHIVHADRRLGNLLEPQTFLCLALD